ncbi:hypothetical protein SLEP1_g39287 [Rubroshorea leprosula]|uniref:Reverse transcriptase domain-containing protein n=1 Tax=Rubroshorea leprosula TaxID=152421 RepID=A0AAV5L017_9ROSI|nr:hypothetical protein SLEP1_g39287 [Rubroshorea leprosula]
MSELEARKLKYPTTRTESLLMGILIEGEEGIEEEMLKREEKYMWAIVDGVKEKVKPLL